MTGAASCMTYPVLPLKSTVLFPQIVMPVAVGRPQSIAATDAALLRPEQTIIAAVQRDPQVQIPTLQDLYPIATLAVIKRVIQRDKHLVQILVQGTARVELIGATQSTPYLQASAMPLPELTSSSPEVIALLRNIQELVDVIVQEVDTIPEEIAQLLLTTTDPVQMAYLIATILPIGLERGMELLAMHDVLHLLQQVYDDLSHEVHIVELRHKIIGDTQNELDKEQRDYVLRQQLKHIKKELGEDDEPDDVGLLRQQLDDTDLPDDVRHELDREVGRLQRLAPTNPDYHILRSYLEFALELPWTTVTSDQDDLHHAHAILNEDHFGLEDIKDRVMEHLAVMQLKPEANNPILCLVGPPGVGKTSLGHAIARALGRGFERFSLGGVHDEAALRGHRRTYIGALPGRILQAMRRVGTRNPVLMLDEVDKMGQDFRGDPASALLEILDPAQNHRFRDHYLDLPFDLSRTFFLCTANTLEAIPTPLLDRMEVITLAGYSEEEKLEIARHYLVPRQIKDTGLQPEQLPLSDTALQTTIRYHTREAGVRQLERMIACVARKIARKVILHETLYDTITPDDLDELLGGETYAPEEVRQHLPCGVAAGLAVTQAGGDVLYVEAQLLARGTGLTLTGQLGNVMRESAEIAWHMLWAEAPAYGINETVFECNGMHIHVPAGAIPKDGPSAGIAMATALVSLLSSQPMRNDTAMTGELTLSGLVLPVGGIKDKVLAARRAGLRRVILPRANTKDLRTLPEAARAELEFVFVERFVEVIRDALPALALTSYSEYAL